MRVIAGTARSIRLVFPRGASMRPTSDMVREALFASLGGRTIDAHFADLYAGSGSVGIEALSRGAASCTFVEQDTRCLEALRANLANTGLAERAQVVRGDCRRVAPRLWAQQPWDIVFLDPPYREDATALVRQLLDLAATSGRSCLIVLQCERGKEPPLPAHREKRYGGTMLLFYECEPMRPAS
ncbi:MAG: 16S rRNA (guanine(966)-N(2))-methyltransferase RsmD [Armatimonadetes bacterium]|nr:16S rRNA (guanine(966)-N(2))-methyltransferase RsmD [Armatimonadota bacterium]